MNGINGYTVWYRLEVAVHNYSYLIIQNNNYNELPTFLMYVILVYIWVVFRYQWHTELVSMWTLTFLNLAGIRVALLN